MLYTQGTFCYIRAFCTGPFPSILFLCLGKGSETNIYIWLSVLLLKSEKLVYIYIDILQSRSSPPHTHLRDSYVSVTGGSHIPYLEN